MKVPLAGGAPVTICDSCTGYLLLLGWRRHRPLPTAPPSNPNSRVLMAVSARGGTPYEIARPDSGSTEAFRAPLLVPGTRTVLFAAFNGSGSRLAALNLDTHAITKFDQQGFSPHWVAAGFVTLASSDGSLIALPFDAKRAGRADHLPITRDVLQPDGFVSRAAVSSQRCRLPAVRRALPTPSGAGRTVGISPADSGRGAGVCQSSFLTRRTPHSTRDHRPDGREGHLVFDVAQRTWSRLTTRRSTTGRSGRRMAVVWSTPATTTSGGSPRTAADALRACWSPTATGLRERFLLTDVQWCFRRGERPQRNSAHGVRFGPGFTLIDPREIRRIGTDALAGREVAGVPAGRDGRWRCTSGPIRGPGAGRRSR